MNMNRWKHDVFHSVLFPAQQATRCASCETHKTHRFHLFPSTLGYTVCVCVCVWETQMSPSGADHRSSHPSSPPVPSARVLEWPAMAGTWGPLITVTRSATVTHSCGTETTARSRCTNTPQLADVIREGGGGGLFLVLCTAGGNTNPISGFGNWIILTGRRTFWNKEVI